MLETKRLFRDTPAFPVLIFLSVLGLLLYFSGQLDGRTFDEYAEKNSVYHAALQEANRTQMDYDQIHREKQELTIRAVLNTPDNYLYDIYLEAYPDYVTDEPNEATKQAILNKEWAYDLLDQQASYYQELSKRLQQMELEFRQKSGSRLFSKNKDLLQSMERTLHDYQSLGNVHSSYGDDRFVLSVLQNRSNIALLLILIFFGCYQMYLPKGQALHSLITSTQLGRRQLKRSSVLCLCIWTAISQFTILVPQFIVSWFLHDGSSQLERTIQSLEPFADYLLPCTVLQFILLYICYAICLSCFVTILFWSVMNLSERLGAAVVILSALVCLSFFCFTLNGNSKYIFLKYCNLIICLSPMDLIRQYRLINIAGLPVHLQTLVFAVFTIVAVILGSLVLLKANKPYPSGRTNPIRRFLIGIRSRIHPDIHFLPSLWEHLKLVEEGKTVLVLAAAIFFGLNFQSPAIYLNNEALVKQAYYQELKAKDPEEALPLLTNNLTATENSIRHLLQDPDKQDDFVYAQILQQYSMQQNALESILSKAEEMKEYNKVHNHPKLFFDIYQADALLYAGKTASGKWRALEMLLLIIFLSAVCFPLEKQSHTIPLIICSRKGITRIFRSKIKAVWIEVFLITLCFAIPEGIQLMKVVPVFAAAQGIPCLNECLYDLSVPGYWGLLWEGRLLILLGISSAVMFFSFLFHTTYAGIIMSESVFCLPNLLPVLFPAWNIGFLPISLLLSFELFTSDMIGVYVIAFILCASLLIMVHRKTKYNIG